jgi:5,6,7,8-tetrahydromethanopterin hydro-lyase
VTSRANCRLTSRDGAAHDVRVVGHNGAEDRVLIGESYAGAGAEAAHINTVWVDPKATDADLVYANNRAATRAALAAGFAGQPSLDEVLAAAEAPANPFYTSPPARRA